MRDRDTAAIRDRLRHVRWIGGGSGGGKSTIARRLADRHGARLYVTDDVMGEHAGRVTAAEAPYVHRFVAMTMDERWLDRTPEVMADTFHWFRGEGFELIVDDLLALPSTTPVIVEGFRLLPELTAPIAAPGRAVWLLPTPEFRRSAFRQRGSLWTIAGGTSNPPAALENLLRRDALFTDRLVAETARRGLPAVTVDGTESEDELTARVGRVLGLDLPVLVLNRLLNVDCRARFSSSPRG